MSTATVTGTAARVVDAVKVYGKGDTEVRALDEVSVGFAAGRFTAITGPSGSGKSTRRALPGAAARRRCPRPPGLRAAAGRAGRPHRPAGRAAQDRGGPFGWLPGARSPGRPWAC